MDQKNNNLILGMSVFGSIFFIFGFATTFILAVGVVFLQVAANPYVTAIGPESGASSRLNLTQALNLVATMIAPWLISVAIFKGLNLPIDDSKITPEQRLMAADRVTLPFIIMGVTVIIVAIAMFTIKLPFMGGISDNFGYTWVFIVPAICYLYIFFYAIKGNTIRRT